MVGVGNIVINTEDHASPSAPYILIKDRFNATLAEANRWNTTALEYLSEMDRMLEGFKLPQGWNDVIKNVTIPNVKPISLTEPTDIGTLTLPDNWPEIFPNDPVLSGTPEVNITTAIPTAPTEVNPNINFSNSTENVVLSLKIFNTILYDLEHGGSGLNKEVEDAILLRDRNRNVVINSEKYNKDMQYAGNTGFRFPSGIIASIMKETSDTIYRQNRESSANLLYENFKLATENKKFSISSGLEYEKIKKEFLLNRDKLTLEADIAAAQLTVNLYNARVEAYKVKFIALQTEAQVAINRVELVIKKNENLIRIYESKLNAIGLKTDVIKSQIDGKVAGFTGKVEAYKAKAAAYESYYKAQSIHEQLKIDEARLELDKAVEEVKALVQGKLSYDTLSTEIAKAISQLAQEASSAAWNAVNASATMGYTGSESINESYSHSDQISEVHSVEHDTNKLF